MAEPKAETEPVPAARPTPPTPPTQPVRPSALASEVVDHWRLYRRMVMAQIRSEWQYRTSFLLFVVAQALVTALELAAIVLLLRVVPDLGGWSPAQVALLYGLATVPFALTDVVVSPVEDLSSYVRTGTLDRLLMRPMSALVQLCAMEFELRRLGKAIPNVAALVFGLAATDVSLTVGNAGLIAMALVSGSAIYTALWIVAASISFWLVAAQEATNALTYGGNFANQYPLHLYPRWIRGVLGWAVPLAFVAYVPAIRIADAPNPLGLPSWLYLLSPPVAVVAVAVSLGIWSIGVRNYQGTGS